MSTMTYLEMQQEVAAMCKMDLADSAQLTLIKRWLNISQEDINSRANWPWLQGREIVQTVADVTTGTVSISASGTAVTGSDTAFSSNDVGSFIQFSTSDDWYKITAVTDTTNATIEKPYVGSTALSGGTYTIRKVYYSLSSTADRVLTCRQAMSPAKLNVVNYRTLDQYEPNVTSTGDPETIVMFGQDSSRNWQFTLHPIPDSVLNLEFRTKLRTIDLTADDGITTIPEKWSKTVMVAGAIWRGMEFNRISREDVRADKWYTIYETGIERMKTEELVNEDQEVRVRSIEEKSRPNEIPFPGEYES